MNIISYPKKCSCCRMGDITEIYQTCPICGWVEDPEQNENPQMKNGRNAKSFEEYYKEFAAGYGMCYCAE